MSLHTANPPETGDRCHPVYLQPRADWDKSDLPDCKKKATAIGILMGVGAAAGSALTAIVAWWPW